MDRLGRDYHELKSIMFAQKVSQETLASALGITEQTLNAKLNGRRNFTDVELVQIVKFLGIDGETAMRIFFDIEIAYRQERRQEK